MKHFLFPLVFIAFTSCDLFESGSQTYTIDQLGELYEEIVSLAESEICTNPSDWDFVGLGSKPCGGPWEYIAYSKKINVKNFLEKVQQYNDLQREDNIRNNRFSNCLFVGPPSGITCEGGKAILIYGG